MQNDVEALAPSFRSIPVTAAREARRAARLTFGETGCQGESCTASSLKCMATAGTSVGGERVRRRGDVPQRVLVEVLLGVLPWPEGGKMAVKTAYQHDIGQF